MARAQITAERARVAPVTAARLDEIEVVEAHPERRRGRWRARQITGAALGFALGAIPVLVSFAVALTASKVVPPPSGAGLVVWWTAVVVASAAAAFGAQGLLRRYFPLVGLLRLALAFPADVPSRLGLAMRACTVRDLQRSMIDLREGALNDPADAAAYVVASAAALQRHDRFTRGHCERVRAYADLLAAEHGVSKEGRQKLRWAALLHDIGKLHVSTEILNKPGALDEHEWVEMHGHAAAGLRLGEPLRAWLGEWVDAIGQHHERFDGTGYPHGLAGTDIALAGRIAAVADCYETMTAARPYKKPMSHAEARQELVSCAGQHFDPAVVHAMLRLSVRRLRWVAGPLALLGDLLAAKLIAGGHPVRGWSVGISAVPRVVATSAAAVGIASLGFVPAATTEVPLAPELTGEVRAEVEVPDGAGAEAEGADVADVVSTPPPASPTPNVTRAQQPDDVVVTGTPAPEPEPEPEKTTATPAVPPERPGDGATPAEPARPAKRP